MIENRLLMALEMTFQKIFAEAKKHMKRFCTSFFGREIEVEIAGRDYKRS